MRVLIASSMGAGSGELENHFMSKYKASRDTATEGGSDFSRCSPFSPTLARVRVVRVCVGSATLNPQPSAHSPALAMVSVDRVRIGCAIVPVLNNV